MITRRGFITSALAAIGGSAAGLPLAAPPSQLFDVVQGGAVDHNIDGRAKMGWAPDGRRCIISYVRDNWYITSIEC